MGMIIIQCKSTTVHVIPIIPSYIHCIAVFVTMLCILVNIHVDQDEMKLELVNIA